MVSVIKRDLELDNVLVEEIGDITNMWRNIAKFPFKPHKTV